MPQENTENNENNKPNDDQTKPNTPDADLVERLVAEKVAAQLKEIKDKLDKSYGARDEALAKAAELERKAREAELARLESEGKHKEALELRLAEEKAAREVLEKRNTELSRDVVVREKLGTLEFKNARAASTAYKDIVEQLVQTDKGDWVHRSGVSLEDFIADFAKDEENSFLFKVKGNSGSGASNGGNGAPDPNKGKSLFNMSQNDVLKMAAEGKLPNQRK